MDAEAQRVPYDEGEIDLRVYIRVLVRYWWFIVGAALVAALVAGVIGLRSTPVYEATAAVVITQSRTELSLEPKFRIVDEGLGVAGSDLKARRSALAGLVRNATIATEVVADLGDQLSPRMRDVARLMGAVEGKVVHGDLIQITARSSSPVTAALVANAWGAEYEKYVNRLFGGGETESAAAIEREASVARAGYESAEGALVDFAQESRVAELERLIGEKEETISSLQAGKQETMARIIEETLAARQQLISAYLDAQTQNRLLAFNKDQEAKRAYIAALIDAEAAARLTAIEKDREARTSLFAQYVDAGIANRLAALEQEQKARREVFTTYAKVQASAQSAVLQEQLDARLRTLTSHYQTKRKLERLLQDAGALQTQISQAGQAGAATNGLAILLLKAQAFASSASLPEGIELRVEGTGDLDADVEAQAADVRALIGVLEARIDELDSAIESLSRELANSQGYDLPEAGPSQDDPLLAALAQRYAELFDVGDLAGSAEAVWQESELAQAIQAKYEELFGVGPLVEGSPAISATTPILEAIKSQYPELFRVGDLSSLTWEVPEENTLASLGTQVATELLQLSDLESLPGSAEASEELDQAIASLEKETRELQAQLEAERAREQELKRARDLAWETYSTVARKAAEVDVSSAMASTLVRFASPAVQPVASVSRQLLRMVLLASLGAFVIAAAVALLVNYVQPDLDPVELIRRLRRGQAS